MDKLELFQHHLLWILSSASLILQYPHGLILKGILKVLQITKCISCLKMWHLFCWCSDYLEYNSNCSSLSVIITDCKRNSFPFSSILTIMNWPGSQCLATLGASTSIRKIFSANFSALRILYIIIPLSVLYYIWSADHTSKHIYSY